MHQTSARDPGVAIAKELTANGFVLIRGVLPEPWLTALRHGYDEAVDEKACSERGLVDERHPPGWFEIARILERSKTFGNLMDIPKIVETASRVLGPDLDLASAGELDYKAPERTTNFCGWHTDFNWIVSLPYPRHVFWIGCYFFVEDITPDIEPLTVMPGTHRARTPPPTNHDYSAENSGQLERAPRSIDGAVDVVGPAGSCLMVNTELWHMSRPNGSPRARKLVKVHYKPPWMKVWGGGREFTDDFVARQTEPIRRQLVGAMPYDEVPWSFAPSATQIRARYPVAQLIQMD